MKTIRKTGTKTNSAVPPLFPQGILQALLKLLKKQTKQKMSHGFYSSSFTDLRAAYAAIYTAGLHRKMNLVFAGLQKRCSGVKFRNFLNPGQLSACDHPSLTERSFLWNKHSCTFFALVQYLAITAFICQEQICFIACELQFEVCRALSPQIC